MSNNKCARYNFDIFTNTLVVSKEFEKMAGIPGTIEQRTMLQYMKDYGDALIVQRYEHHKGGKLLNFTQMEKHLSRTSESEKLLARFEAVKELSEGQKSPYNYVKNWFLDNFYNYNDPNPEFDENNRVIAKTRKQVDAEKKAAAAKEKQAVGTTNTAPVPDEGECITERPELVLVEDIPA